MEGIRQLARLFGTPGLAPGVLVVLLMAAPAQALVLSGVSNITLQATKTSALTVTVTSGSSINFTLLQGAIANGSTAAAITTSWNVNPGQTGTVRLYAYFTSAAAALAAISRSICANSIRRCRSRPSP